MEINGNMEIKKYIKLKDLEVYKLARELSKSAWEIYNSFNWQIKKIIGDQFIKSTDSVGANIAEGYGRFHYLDKIKFFYNARASLVEAIHWVELLKERNRVTDKQFESFLELSKEISLKLQNFISSTYKAKNNEK